MRIISVLSTKGGVGKTTLVTNLSATLAKLGYEIIAIDANFTTPHLGAHLGFHLAPYTLHDVLKEQISLKHAIYIHPSGFKFVPGSINLEDLIDLKTEEFKNLLKEFSNSDFIFIDCAPGLGKEATIGLESGEEVLIVTNPELPSIIDTIKTIKVAEMLDKKIIGIVLNRVGRTKNELKKEKIEEILNKKVIAQIPEDKNVAKSIALKLPAVEAFPNSKASIEMVKLAYKLANLPVFERKRFSLIDKLLEWLT